MKPHKNKFFTHATLFYAIVTLLQCSTLRAEPAASPKPNLTIDNITKAQDDYVQFGDSTLEKFDFEGRDLFRKGTAQKQVLYIGDSNMQQYWPRIEKVLQQKPAQTKTAVFAVAGLCLPMPDLIDTDHPQCKGFVENALAYAQRPEIDTVVLAAEWVGSINDIPANSLSFAKNGFKGYLRPRSEAMDRAFADFDQMIKDLRSRGKKVYLVLNIPVDPDFDPKNWVHRSLHVEIVAPTLKKGDFLQRYDPVIAHLKAVGKSSGATVIDPVESICDQENCPSTTPDGDPIYKDGFHLRASYVREHAKYMDQTILK